MQQSSMYDSIQKYYHTSFCPWSFGEKVTGFEMILGTPIVLGGELKKFSKKLIKTLKNLYFLNMAFRITAFILVNIGSISFDILNNKFQKTMIHYWISTCNRINLDYVTPNSFLELLYFAFKYVDSFVLPLNIYLSTPR